MTDKSKKTINWVNMALSVVILILECIPVSIKYACRIGANEYGPTKYWSYFGNPLSVDGPFLITVIIATLTILGLIFNIIILFKDKKSIRIFSAILTFLALAGSIIIFINSAFTAIITILFFVEFVLQGIVLRGNIQVENKKIEIFNWLNVLILLVALILEILPKSVKVEYTISSLSGTTSVYYNSYFVQPSGLISVITAVIAISTVFAVVCGIVSLIKDKKPIRITLLVWVALAEVNSIALLISLGKTIGVYNIIITLLFIVPIVTQSLKLKWQSNENMDFQRQ